MKERPVIFSGEMVRAILDGRKTQTRRVMKVQPKQHDHKNYDAPWACESPDYYNTHEADWACRYCGEGIGMDGQSVYRCPFGQVGDRLWVRETFAAFDADWKHPGKPHDLRDGPWPNVVYPASVAKIPDGTCRPSIHMPRWASRITLEITAVRVERLNDISHDDAKAEGCCYGRGGGVPDFAVTPADHFPTLWASIYGEESWCANPWVWVIEFRRVEVRDASK